MSKQFLINNLKSVVAGCCGVVIIATICSIIKHSSMNIKFICRVDVFIR